MTVRRGFSFSTSLLSIGADFFPASPPRRIHGRGTRLLTASVLQSPVGARPHAPPIETIGPRPYMAVQNVGGVLLGLLRGLLLVANLSNQIAEGYGPDYKQNRENENGESIGRNLHLLTS